jgi:SAM-dependent methyltransferase
LLYSGVEDRLGVAPGKWSFYRCDECGSCRIEPAPAAHELRGFYPTTYGSSLSDRIDAAPLRWLAWWEHHLFFQPMIDRQVRRITRITGRPAGPKPRMLDVGCGRGMRLASFRRLGYETLGVDFHPEYAAFAERRYGAPVICAALDELGSAIEPASFDLITAYYVIEHVPDVRSLLDACLIALKPGGWFVAAVPVADSAQAKVFGKRWSQFTEAPRHVTLPTRRGLTQALEDIGYTGAGFLPDSVALSAATAALSVFPKAAATCGAASLRAVFLARRASAIVTAALWLPCAVMENYIWRRPGVVIAVARKPEDQPCS